MYDNITMHLYAEDSVTRCFDRLYISNFDLNVFYYITSPNNLEPCNYCANTVIETIDKIKYLKIIIDESLNLNHPYIIISLKLLKKIF